ERPAGDGRSSGARFSLSDQQMGPGALSAVARQPRPHHLCAAGSPAHLEPSSTPPSAARDDGAAVSRPAMQLGVRSDLPHRTGAPAVPVRSVVARQPQVTFTGWAGDLRARTPAREVIATFNGRIIGRSTPNADRPDVVAAGYPAGFRGSGFRLTSPTSANASG